MLCYVEEHFEVEDHVRVEKPLKPYFEGGELLVVMEADCIVCFKVLTSKEGSVGQMVDFPFEQAEQYLRAGVLEILA